MAREIVGSKAFNLEYEQTVLDQELRDDVVSYLGEYRLQVSKYDYQLVFSSDASGKEPMLIRDLHKGESMQKKARRSIQERTERKDPIHRERAEEKGIQKLEVQIATAQTGDTILWMSPPGPKEQGYENYSFLFKGDVTKHIDGSASLAMQAIRLNEASLDQGREFFSTVLGEDVVHQTPEDFIESPVVLPFTLPEPLLDKTLKQHFTFETSGRDQEKFAWIIKKMDRHIDEFIRFTKYGTRDEKIRAFYALENYAIELNKSYDSGSQVTEVVEKFHGDFINLAALIDAHGHKPPTTGGSCGSTSETKQNIFQSPLQAFLRSALAEALYGDESSECESCGEPSSDNHYHCPDCNKQFSDETNVPPERRTAACSCGFEFGCGSKEIEDKSGEVDVFTYVN